MEPVRAFLLNLHSDRREKGPVAARGEATGRQFTVEKNKGRELGAGGISDNSENA